MSRKDYQLIADALRTAKSNASLKDNERAGIDRASVMLADFLKEDNPRFDRARFLAATR